jgi:UDP-N-acetylmuramoyl-L-alanine---L-glutamate ligase
MPTRPTISWSDLKGSAVGLWGLGVEGRANLRRLRADGVTPALVDDSPGDAAVDGLPVVATAAGGLEALARCDVVIKTPGISRYREDVAGLEAAGVAVVGGLGLWMQAVDRSRVVVVTGTKGKSTTTAIAGHLLGGLGYRCLVAGNIGRPPYDPEVGDDYDFWAVETSSFQATDLAASPPVVAVTALHPDHLDWHGDVETYYRDKLSACTQPGAALTVANGDSDELRARVSSLGPAVVWVGAADAPADGWTGALGVAGAHNRRNAQIARACLEALGVGAAADDDRLAAAAAGFVPLEHRLHPIGTVGGVAFVDDSLSTNALSVIAALDTFAAGPVALLVGGQDRGVDYAELGSAVRARSQPTFVVTLPANGPRIGAAILDADAGATVIDADDLQSAVAAAFAWAAPRRATVLLSPGAPSFGQFANYRARALAFAGAMRAQAGPTG